MLYFVNNILLIIPLFSALLVINFKNPIYVIISMLITFLTTAICWIVLDAEFLAFSLVLLYIGAIIVLFLFALMMLNIKYSKLPAKSISIKSLIALLITSTLVATLIYVAKDYNFSVVTIAANNNLSLLANELFNKHLILFAMSGLLLLSAIIIAINLLVEDIKKP